jgi:A/G-specific adenine glycosylase
MNTARLLEWYGLNKRDLPWRKTSDIYAVLVSEMMLQQTTVETALRYYARFLERFPDVQTLALAEEESVLAAWKGLGYYARARNLHRLAKQVAANGGVFPATLEGWRKLDGVGPYIAGAVTSIALGLPHAAVDGNVLRVFARIDGIRDDMTQPQMRKRVESRVQKLIPHETAGNFTQALMELGALVCRPASPDCAACPVSRDCTALAQGLAHELPVRKPREKQQSVALWVAVVEAPGSVLMEYRKDETLLARMWGLPNVEKNPDKPAEALFEDKYGITLAGGQSAGHAVHVFTHRRWEMGILRYKTDTKFPVSSTLEWVSREQLEHKPVPTAFLKVLRALWKEKSK